MLVIITLLLLYIAYRQHSVMEQNQALGRNDHKIAAQLKVLIAALEEKL